MRKYRKRTRKKKDKKEEVKGEEDVIERIRTKEDMMI